jgi:hypothetical protein
MSAPGSRAKRSSSSVKVRPRSLSIASNILRSSSLSSLRAASLSGVSGGDGSSGENTAINAAAVAKFRGESAEKDRPYLSQAVGSRDAGGDKRAELPAFKAGIEADVSELWESEGDGGF